MRFTEDTLYGQSFCSKRPLIEKTNILSVDIPQCLDICLNPRLMKANEAKGLSISRILNTIQDQVDTNRKEKGVNDDVNFVNKLIMRSMQFGESFEYGLYRNVTIESNTFIKKGHFFKAYKESEPRIIDFYQPTVDLKDNNHLTLKSILCDLKLLADRNLQLYQNKKSSWCFFANWGINAKNTNVRLCSKIIGDSTRIFFEALQDIEKYTKIIIDMSEFSSISRRLKDKQTRKPRKLEIDDSGACGSVESTSLKSQESTEARDTTKNKDSSSSMNFSNATKLFSPSDFVKRKCADSDSSAFFQSPSTKKFKSQNADKMIKSIDISNLLTLENSLQTEPNVKKYDGMIDFLLSNHISNVIPMCSSNDDTINSNIGQVVGGQDFAFTSNNFDEYHAKSKSDIGLNASIKMMHHDIKSHTNLSTSYGSMDNLDNVDNTGQLQQLQPVVCNDDYLLNKLKNATVKRGPKKDNICEFCGKVFDRPSLLIRHRRTHTGEKPHVCTECNKAFSTSSSLNTHFRIHTGEKPHKCHVCGKRFTASSNLYYHRMTHQTIKPHQCTECVRSFPTPGDLRNHMYLHFGNYPFTCGACQKGFGKKTTLKYHQDKRYPLLKCKFCKDSFSTICGQKLHLKDAHNFTTSNKPRLTNKKSSNIAQTTTNITSDLQTEIVSNVNVNLNRHANFDFKSAISPSIVSKICSPVAQFNPYPHPFQNEMHNNTNINHPNTITNYPFNYPNQFPPFNYPSYPYQDPGGFTMNMNNMMYANLLKSYYNLSKKMSSDKESNINTFASNTITKEVIIHPKNPQRPKSECTEDISDSKNQGVSYNYSPQSEHKF